MESKSKKPTKAKKQWKGEKQGGPAPARHIPWPEIFKHHISVVEGHLRMMEMIQKHTVQGTGNFETITTIVKRCQEMLYQTKDATRSFIPPKNQRESVPLGSSSLSMYPGYSPEDIEYGKAAGEAGKAIGDIRKQGLKWEGPANGAEYQIGQAHGAKRKLLFKKDKIKEPGNEDAIMTDGAVYSNQEERVREEADDKNPYFVIDTNPTPVSVPTTKPKSSKKRALEDEVEGLEKKKSKKERNDKEIVVETEDISEEVEAALKAKEEKAKAKEEKKRPRSSSDRIEPVAKKSKKDKSKKTEAAESGAEGSGDGDGKKKKTKKSKT